MNTLKKTVIFTAIIGTILTNSMPIHAGLTDYLLNKKTAAVAALAATGTFLYTYKKSSLSFKEYVQQLKERATKTAKAYIPLAKVAAVGLAGCAAFILGAKKLEKIPGMPKNFGDKVVGDLFFFGPISALGSLYLKKVEQIMKKSIVLVPTQPCHTFATLPGHRPQEIRIFIDQLKNPKKYPPQKNNGLLLHGYYGTGKTAFAHAIATELGAPLFLVTPGLVCEGSSLKAPENIKAIFSIAAQKADEHPTGKVVLCIDEIDAIARARTVENSSDTLVATITELQTQLNDSIKGKVIVIATTNHPHLIEPAITRPGRLIPIKIDVPNLKSRQAIANYYLRKAGLTSDITEHIKLIVQKCEGMSPAEIAHIIDTAHSLAIKKNIALSADFIQQSLALFEKNRTEVRVRGGVRQPKQLEPESKQRAAVAATAGIGVGLTTDS